MIRVNVSPQESDIAQRLIDSGVPITAPEFRLTREGVLQYEGSDLVSGADIWCWYEKDEWRGPGEPVQ